MSQWQLDFAGVSGTARSGYLGWGSPANTTNISRAGTDIAWSPSHLEDEAAEVRSAAAPTPPDWPRVLPQTHTLSYLPAITHKGPPLHPCSEWHANLPWALRHPQWAGARDLISFWDPRLHAPGLCAVSICQKEPTPIPAQVPRLADSAGWDHMARHPAQVPELTYKCAAKRT